MTASAGAVCSAARLAVQCSGGAKHGIYFPVGTRNATEQALERRSQVSESVSLLPILELYKTEVLELCAYLGVPQICA